MADILFQSTVKTPIGAFFFSHDGSSVVEAGLCSGDKADFLHKDPLSQTVEKAIQSYFYEYCSGALQCLPLRPKGTLFQQKVWQALCEIPTGQVRTYGDLAKILQTAPRAIGQACRSNPIMLLIPCHRVVAQNGLGGFMGKSERISLKESLLHHERCFT